MINTLNENLDKIINIAVMVMMSLYLRVLLQAAGQTWIKTIAHTSTLMLLPILTYIITSVISGNIALSLGMVGALSIVRFRNPVRSPLELSVYFGAITIGISTAVSIKWTLLLIGSVTLVVIILYVVQKITSLFSTKPFFISSFSEGNHTSVLHVSALNEVQELDSNKLLSSKIIDDGKITYILASSNFDILKGIEKSLRSNEIVVSVQLNK
ncbi:DUF4956 domain-containing protein [Amylibacter sp.]|nr:DUF4956 domain-containing protein [Amylibacter sp.]